MVVSGDNYMKIMCVWTTQMSIGLSYEQLHYVQALEEIGHKVSVFDLMPKDPGDHIDQILPIDGELLDIIKYKNPDIVIIKLYRNTLTKETIKHISKSRITIGIFGDDEKFFDSHSDTTSIKFAPCFTWVVTTYLPAVDRYKSIGLKNIIHSGYGANNFIFRKIKVKKTVNISICGTRNRLRIEFLNYLVLKGLLIKVFGHGWSDTSILSERDYIYLINTTKINLNISEDEIGKNTIVQIKGRDFEVPMCGGFLLTKNNPLLRQFYVFGKEIEVYDSVEQANDKIKYYLKHEDKRKKIALAGYRRAQKDHTYKKRFRNILKRVKRG